MTHMTHPTHPAPPAPDPLYIDDGYTREHDLAPAPGLHPGVRIAYRPALDRARKDFDEAVKRGAEALERFECALLARQLVALNGEPVEAERLGRLHPTVRAVALNLVLSFTPAKRAEAEGNSGGASG